MLGYCPKGARCTDRHVHECPDYANTGVCGKSSCHLPHVARAGQIRKHAANTTGNAAKNKPGITGKGDNDLSSDDGDHDRIDTDDVDSDGLDDDDMIETSVGGGAHAISQQQDFVRF